MRKRAGRWFRIVVLAVLSACSVFLIAGCDPDKEGPTPPDTVSGPPTPREQQPPQPQKPDDTGEPYVPPAPLPPTDTGGGDTDPTSAPSFSPSPRLPEPEPDTSPAQVEPQDPDGT